MSVKGIPQILIGASSSSKLGWRRKISLEATQSCLISDSESWTCLPGLPDRTSVSLLIISSSTAGSIPPCPCEAIQRGSAFFRAYKIEEEETLEIPMCKKNKDSKQLLLFSLSSFSLFFSSWVYALSCLCLCLGLVGLYFLGVNYIKINKVFSREKIETIQKKVSGKSRKWENNN